MSTPLRLITADLLDDLQDVFPLVEVTVHNQCSVRLKVKLPPSAEPKTAEREELAKAYDVILRKHGIFREEKPSVVNGFTGHVISIKVPAPKSGEVPA